MLLVVLSGSLYAQERTITGKVTDASDGSGLPGVNIAVKGTAQGTITDMDGKYTIAIPSDDASLSFSFLGYKTKTVVVGSQTTIDVALEVSDVAIDDVVVTALGISKEKKSLGYAVTEVSGEEITNVKQANVVNSLSGRVAGVTLTQSTGGVGAGTRVIIRGNSSLTGNNQPLYVVDGVPIDNSGFGSADGAGTANYKRSDFGTGISDINPDDIESISVLKGPNAAALYGSRASNGVILITTKKGKAGKGLGVSYSLQTAWSNPLLLPKYQNEYGQGSNGDTYTDLATLKTNGGSWGAKMDGSNQLMWTGDTKAFSPNPNNVEDFFQTGSNYINTIALDGGNENSSVRFSYTNNKTNGILENSWLKKNNFNLRGMTKMGRLSLDAKITYFNQEANNRATQGTEGIMAYVYGVPRNMDFNDMRNYQNPADYSVNSWTSSSGNPYWILFNDVRKDSRTRMNGFAKATYEITDYLSAYVRVGTDLVSQNIETVDNYGHWFYATGQFNYSNRTTTESNADFLLMFNKDITSDINLSVNFGGNMRYNTYTSQSVFGENFKIPTKPTTSSAQTLKPYYTPLQEKKVHSLYGNASIGYKNMIYLDITGRNDWSSALPKDNWSYFYPSASLSILLDQMIQPIGDIFDLFKIRASWARVGNDTGPYQLEDTYNLQQEGYLGLTTLSRSSVKMNPDLKPEQTTSLDLGADFSLFNNRLYANFSYYKIESRDLIMDVPVPSSTGYDYFRENVGLLINEGGEFMIGGAPVVTNDFRWDISFNFSKNNNRLVELIEDLDNYIFSTNNSGSVVVQASVKGHFGEIWATTYDYDDNGKMIVDATGRPIAAAEKELVGNYQPDWVGGLNNTLTYKNFNLNFLIDFRIGGQVYSGTDAALDANGTSERSLQYRTDGYTYTDAVLADGTPNTTAITGQEYWGNRMASDYIYDQTNIRLREFSLIYNFPKAMFDGIFIEDVSLGVIGRNLFFFKNSLESFDAESSYSTSNYAQGMLYYNLPSTRSFGFNLNIKF